MVLSWIIRDKVIHSLHWKGRDLIYPWGLETADSSGFFSLEKGAGYRFVVQKEELSSDRATSKSHQVVHMPEGVWKLDSTDSLVSPNFVDRCARLECIADSMFMDFVMRFRFRKELFDVATIGGKRILHSDSNRNYQYPAAEEVVLHGRELSAQVSIVDKDVPDKMRPYMYVRDSGEEWIVHARMLPVSADREVIKLCNRLCGTRPIPSILSRAILKSKKIKDMLWYRGEKGRSRNLLARMVNPNAFPLVALPQGEVMQWRTRTTISEV